MSEHMVGLPERTNQALLKIIRDNFATQYATQATSLAEFRNAVLAHGGTDVDATLLADFRAHVPLSDYSLYKPFVDRFNVQPCKEKDVENMFSPGLPDLFATSSATTGTSSKILPLYNHNAKFDLSALVRIDLDLNSEDPFAAVLSTQCRDIKVIERAPGEVVQRIPVCCASGGFLRRSFGVHTDDESHMSFNMTGYAVPWAATVIKHVPSFLVIHGLFFLMHSDAYHFFTPFATQFVDLIRHIDAHWDLLLSCIRDGTLPDLEGIEDVRGYLQAHLRPNPERAAELCEIGPPFSFEGWFARVWPKADCVSTICGGPFATVLPKLRSILGPSVTVRNFVYGASEAIIGIPHDANKLDEFIFHSDDIIEFLDVSLHATYENLCQAWEVEVGKDYEPILTTRNGLWRYRLGDVLHIVGFDTQSKSPLFTFVGRRSLTIRLPGRISEITDKQLLAAVQSCGSEDGVLAHEFTTTVDNRTLVPTIGFFVELAGPLGPNAHLVSQKLFDALVAYGSVQQAALSLGRIRLPTIRIVKAGTFAEYRWWKAKSADIASTQIKVPLVLLDPRAQEWILERVVEEL